MKDKQQVVVSRTMKDCEEMQADDGFIRVHQSYMINLACVKKFTRDQGGTVEMEVGAEVDVSCSKKVEFREALRKL